MSGEQDEDAEPGRLEVRVGEEVRLRVATEVPLELELELDGEPIARNAIPDAATEIDFSPSEPGRYQLRDRRSDALIATIEVRP